MAGYVMTLDNKDSLKKSIKDGIYSTILSAQPDGHWKPYHEATFADFSTMKPGDNIYFFIKRKIYGIGELVSIDKDCKFLNFPNANTPNFYEDEDVKKQILRGCDDELAKQRWVCTFKPSPYFFMEGVDMDEVLASNPSKFKMLRVFWKLSFLKVDDEENQAFKDVILKRNQGALAKNVNEKKIFPSDYDGVHSKIEKILAKSKGEYDLHAKNILAACSDGAKLNHEKAIEAGLLCQLSVSEKNALNVFGSWDYLHHQVFASPFKPVDYMDKMDVFGYSFIKGFCPTKSKYLLIEIKRYEASEDDVDQTMKYVDWINQEDAHGDYSMIKAFLVAHEFSEDVIKYAKENGRRRYIIGTRPARSKEWIDLTLVKYSFNKNSGLLEFEQVAS